MIKANKMAIPYDYYFILSSNWQGSWTKLWWNGYGHLGV